MSSDLVPLKAGQPHVAIVVLWYPLFTQPFIFREVESLSRVIPTEVYTLYDLNLSHCSREMKKAAGRARTYGMKSFFSVFGHMAKSFFRQPSLMWNLFRQSLFHKWTSFEVFGENLWGFIVGISLGDRFMEEGIDIVYAPWPRGAATAARVAGAIAGIPYVVSARGDNLDPPDPDLLSKLQNARIIRANNAADRQRIEKLSGLRARVKTELVYNSLTLPLPSGEHPPFEKNGPARLLALGRFDVTKGFDVLLKACGLLKRRGIDFHLTLAGGGGKVMGLGDMGGQLLELRKSLNLENEVSMPGLVSHDALPLILQSHDIFVAPCVIHESGRRDGIPNTVIEALAYGLPVVSTDVNALPEVVKDGETGLLVPPGDEQALADAIMRLVMDPALSVWLGRNASALAAQMFDPAQNALKLASMFSAAMNPVNGDDASCVA